MGRPYSYPDLNPEHLEELRETEMSESERNIWEEMVKFVIRYFHCSKPLAALRVREYLREYKHPVKKMQGCSGGGFKNKGTTRSDELRKRMSISQRKRYQEHPEQCEHMKIKLKEVWQKKKELAATSAQDEQTYNSIHEQLLKYANNKTSTSYSGDIII